jgi:hypothetical protein
MESKRKSFNKFLLKILFNDEKENIFNLKIKVCYFHDSFIFNYEDDMLGDNYPIFESSNNFTMYSLQGGMISEYVFLVPDRQALNKSHPNKITISRDFKTDDERKNFLMGLYICLEEFGKDWIGFKNTPQINDNLKIRNNLWYM